MTVTSKEALERIARILHEAGWDTELPQAPPSSEAADSSEPTNEEERLIEKVRSAARKAGVIPAMIDTRQALTRVAKILREAGWGDEEHGQPS